MSSWTLSFLDEGVERLHGQEANIALIRDPLRWDLHVRRRVIVWKEFGDGETIWLGFSVSYFSLCRASKLRAFPDRLSPGILFDEGSHPVRNGHDEVLITKPETANKVEVRFHASNNSDRRRE